MTKEVERLNLDVLVALVEVVDDAAERDDTCGENAMNCVAVEEPKSIGAAALVRLFLDDEKVGVRSRADLPDLA